jgi:hypothetical protein
MVLAFVRTEDNKSMSRDYSSWWFFEGSMEATFMFANILSPLMEGGSRGSDSFGFLDLIY